MSAINPLFTVGSLIVETIRAHRPVSRRQAMEQAERLLGLVGIPDPARRLQAYPHELSGGMCQRAMIAMALCCEPRLLIADEPTTALDVSIRHQILDLLERIRSERGLAVVMPGVERSYYTDMASGPRWWTHVSEELPRLVAAMFPVSDRREETFVAGLSMGGYGAFKLALRQPGRFAAAASLSGATGFTR